MENHNPTDNLVRMANQIGAFFESMPDHTEAVDGIANHISKFWEPRMRKHILAHIAVGGEGLSDIAREAITKGVHA